MVDEKELLQRVRELDEEALTSVFDEYYMPLYRYIYHHLGHVEVAQDLAADVFYRLVQRVAAGHGPSHHLRGWLYRVARNLLVDYLRKLEHRDHGQLYEAMASSSPSVPAQAEGAILAEQARTALRELTPKQRDVIILKYLDGYENEEVAEIMGLSVGAVKSLRFRGLAALRRHLARIGAVSEETT